MRTIQPHFHNWQLQRLALIVVMTFLSAAFSALFTPSASASVELTLSADAVNQTAVAAKEAGKLLDDGKPAEAEALLKPALVAALAAFGEKHAVTLDLLDVKAEIYFEQGRYDECVHMRVREVELRKEVNGAEDEATLTTMSNLAVALASAGRHMDGVNAFTAALVLQRRVLGEKHETTVKAIGDLASAQLRAGLHTDALRNLELGYQLRNTTLGPKNPRETQI